MDVAMKQHQRSPRNDVTLVTFSSTMRDTMQAEVFEHGLWIKKGIRFIYSIGTFRGNQQLLRDCSTTIFQNVAIWAETSRKRRLKVGQSTVRRLSRSWLYRLTVKRLFLDNSLRPSSLHLVQLSLDNLKKISRNVDKLLFPLVQVYSRLELSLTVLKLWSKMYANPLILSRFMQFFVFISARMR